jgi:type IV secretion system protein VirD4
MSANSRSEPDFDPAVLVAFVSVVVALLALVFLAVQWPVFVWSLIHLRPMLLSPTDAIGGGLDLLFSTDRSVTPDAWRGVAELLPPPSAWLVLNATGALVLFVVALAVGLRLELWKGRSRLGLRSWDPRARLRRRAFARGRDVLHLMPRQPINIIEDDFADMAREIETRALRLLAGQRRVADGPGGDSWPLGFGFGRELYSSPEKHMLVIGASGSGKTMRTICRAAVEHDGALVAISSKQDVYNITRVAGAILGEPVSIFAPGVKLDPDRHDVVKWTPLAGCGEWEYALHMGRWIYEANPNLGRRDSGGEFYDREATEILLPPLLHAAALGGKRMAHVYRWVIGDGVSCMDEAAGILEAHQAHDALDVLRSVQLMPDRQRSFTLSAARQLVSAYQYTSVCESDADGFDVEAFIRSNRSLHIVIPDSRADKLAPIVGGLLGAILRACEERAATGADPRTLPIVKVIADEAAHLTPLRSLPTHLAVSRGHGVRWLLAYQTIGQIEERYHGDAQAVTANTLVKQFMGPVQDRATRDEITALLGGEHVTSVTHNSDRLGLGGGRSERSEYRPKVGAEDLVLLPEGHTLIVHGNDLPFITEAAIFVGYEIRIR